MSLHGWVTAGLAVGVLGLAAFVATGPEPAVDAPPEGADAERRIDELESRLEDALRRLEARPRIGRHTEPAAAAAADPSALPSDLAPDEATVSVDVEQRLRALEARLDLVAAEAGVDLTDPTTLSTDDLMKRAHAQTAANRQGARGVAGYAREEALWREALSRDLTDEQRHSAQFALGIALRGQKRHDEEAAVFEEMILRAGGIDTEQGVSAGFQLAWARVYSEDERGSVEAFDRVVNSAAVSPVLRVHSLLRAGQYAQRASEPDRARAYFRRLLEDHRADVPSSQPWIVSQAEQAMKELDAN